MTTTTTLEKLEAFFLGWATDRDLLHAENDIAQMGKVLEEAHELEQAVLNDDQANFEEEAGDVIVSLAILCAQRGTNLAHCAGVAREKIKNRKGKTVGGTFVKE